MGKRSRANPPPPRKSNSFPTSYSLSSSTKVHKPSFMSSIFQGASFGGGTELGRQAVRFITGYSNTPQQPIPSSSPSTIHSNYCNTLLEDIAKAFSKEDIKMYTSLQQLYKETCENK